MSRIKLLFYFSVFIMSIPAFYMVSLKYHGNSVTKKLSRNKYHGNLVTQTPSKNKYHGNVVTKKPSGNKYHGNVVTKKPSGNKYHGNLVTQPPSRNKYHGNVVTKKPSRNMYEVKKVVTRTIEQMNHIGKIQQINHTGQQMNHTEEQMNHTGQNHTFIKYTYWKPSSRPYCAESLHSQSLSNLKSLKNINFVKKTEFLTCPKLLEKQQYMTDPPLPEELEMPVAYSIIMYRDPEQAEFLLRAIYRPHNYYCIHVDKDKKYSHVYNQMKAVASCLKNVLMVSSRVKVRWGKFSVVQAEMHCMKDLIKYASWKYFINLTGQEYPLKTSLELVKILKLLNGTNLINGQELG